jgi:hypothetical protein
MRLYPFLYYNILISCCLLWANSQMAYAQNGGKNLIQFSGVVLVADSVAPVFYASVYNLTSKRGEVSNAQGFFSIVVESGDKIRFSAVGYRTDFVTIPHDLKSDTYSIIQFLEPDTIQLPTVLVGPYPKPSQFEQAFMMLDLPNTELQQAKENLDREKMRDSYEVLAMDGTENFNQQMKQYTQSQYWAGQSQPIQLLNPIAWAAFFKALKNGDFKKRKTNK